MTRLKLIDENDELIKISEQIQKGMQKGICEASYELGSIEVRIKVPSNCKNCPCRLNDSREHWKCFLVRTIRNTPHYIPKTVADDERADFCPFNKKG